MADAVLRAGRLARDEGFAKHGEHIVVAGGIPFGTAGTTNSLRVTTVK
jgi:pyruvate kinase